MIQIVVYKEAGLSLETIAELLASPGTKAVVILEQRLKQLNHQISQLRQQQQLVIKLLNKESLLRQAKVMTVDQWVKMLEAAGMDAEARRQWHREFERAMPEAHTDFLESLGMEKAEIKRIKTQYQ